MGQKNSDENLDIVRKMSARYGDKDIAYVLSKLGRKTGKGNRWTQERVAAARHRLSLPGRKHTLPDPEVLNMNQTAEYCDVSTGTIKKLVARGILPKEQIVPWAPWEIQRRDLDTDPVFSIIKHLRATGKLVLEGPGLEKQIGLFQ